MARNDSTQAQVDPNASRYLQALSGGTLSEGSKVGTGLGLPSLPIVPTHESEAAVVADLVERHAGGFLMGDLEEIGKAYFAVLPVGKRIESLKPILDQYLPRPERATGFASLRTISALIEHALRHSDARRSVIFADHEAGMFRSIYDYHSAGTTGAEVGMNGEPMPDEPPRFTAPGEPGWCGHGATYAPKRSPEFLAWLTVAGKELTGAQFAEFLEDHMQDMVAAPIPGSALDSLVSLLGAAFGTPTDLLAVSRNLSVNVAIAVNDARTLATGEVSVAYAETHSDGRGQPLRVPSIFGIGIPVYYGEGAFQIGVRLRYRIVSGKVTWTLLPYRLDVAQQSAFDELVQRVREETMLPVFEGCATE